MDQVPLHQWHRLFTVCNDCVQQLFILSVNLHQMCIRSSLLKLASRIYPNFQPKTDDCFPMSRRKTALTTQQFCLSNILNFDSGFQRHRLSRFSALCSRVERDPLRCGLWPWYWWIFPSQLILTVSNSYWGSSSWGDVFHIARVGPQERDMITHSVIKSICVQSLKFF